MVPAVYLPSSLHARVKEVVARVAIVVFIIGFILQMNGSDIGGWLIPWVAAIIKVIRAQKWGWAIGLLVFGVLGTVAYGIWGPEDQYA